MRTEEMQGGRCLKILSQRGRTWIVPEVPPEPTEPVVGLLASVVHPVFGQAGGKKNVLIWVDSNGQPSGVYVA
jgi:hypothetical protein